jgi:hypothetical protein
MGWDAVALTTTRPRHGLRYDDLSPRIDRVEFKVNHKIERKKATEANGGTAFLRFGIQIVRSTTCLAKQSRSARLALLSSKECKACLALFNSKGGKNCLATSLRLRKLWTPTASQALDSSPLI